MDERGLPVIIITMALVLAGLLLFILVRDSNSPDPLTPVGAPAVLTPAQVTTLQDAARTQDEVLAKAQALVAQLATLLAAPVLAAVTTTTTTLPSSTSTTSGASSTSTSTSTTTTVPARPLDGICRATRLC